MAKKKSDCPIQAVQAAAESLDLVAMMNKSGSEPSENLADAQRDFGALTRAVLTKFHKVVTAKRVIDKQESPEVAAYEAWKDLGLSMTNFINNKVAGNDATEQQR